MQKGHYIINLPNGQQIEIGFTVWTFKKFAQSKGLSVDQLLDYISGQLLTTEDMISLMLIGAEYSALKTKAEFKYTEFDACEWLQGIGGLTSPQLKEMTIIMIASLVDKDPSDVKEMLTVEVEQQSEKKSNRGTASTSGPQKRASSRGKQTKRR